MTWRIHYTNPKLVDFRSSPIVLRTNRSKMWEVARLCGWNKVSFWSLLYSNALQTANQTNFWHFSSFVPLQRIREHRRHRKIHTVNPANMLFIEFDGAVKPVGRIHKAIYKTFSAHTRRASSSYLTLCCVPAPPFHRTPPHRHSWNYYPRQAFSCCCCCTCFSICRQRQTH